MIFAALLIGVLAGGITTYLAVHHRLVAQEKLAMREKLDGLGLLASGVAHEINNPMSYVTSNVAGLIEDLKTIPKLEPALETYVREILPETMDGIRRVNQIVTDLGFLARADPKGMVEYDLNEQVKAALGLVREKRTLPCEVSLQLAPLPRATGFPGQITQALVSLLLNAVDAQAGERRGTITVTTRADGNTLVASVRDQGVGISKEARKKLFVPFFTTKPVGQGQGLGLAAVHGIARTHCGWIDVESDEEKGSTFSLWLPLVPELEQRA